MAKISKKIPILIWTSTKAVSEANLNYPGIAALVLAC
jgi:hypothetical protein